MNSERYYSDKSTIVFISTKTCDRLKAYPYDIISIDECYLGNNTLETVITINNDKWILSDKTFSYISQLIREVVDNDIADIYTLEI